MVVVGLDSGAPLPVKIDCSRVAQVEELQLSKGRVDRGHNALRGNESCESRFCISAGRSVVSYLDDVGDKRVVS